MKGSNVETIITNNTPKTKTKTKNQKKKKKKSYRSSSKENDEVAYRLSKFIKAQLNTSKNTNSSYPTLFQNFQNYRT